MQLFYKCENCRAFNKVKITASDRSAIRDKYPDGVQCKCPICNFNNNVHANKVVARESKLIPIFGITAMLISIVLGAVFLKAHWSNDLGKDLYVLAAFATIISLPFIILGVLIKNERKAVKIFNNYYV